MPFLGVQFAAGEDVEGRACGKGYIRDDKTSVMCWEVVVDRSWKDPVAVVNKEDEEEDGERQYA